MAALAPPRPHHHPENGPTYERRSRIDLDAAAIGHVGGTAGYLPLQRWIEKPDRLGHIGPGG
jgi:hypothetical protein